MALTCTCTCNYCRTIREDDFGAEENSWLSRNRSRWNLVEIPLFILIVLFITICGALPVILYGGIVNLPNASVIHGMIMYAISWVSFAWSFSKTYLINRCPTCSNKCRINAARELARQLSTTIFNPPSSQANLRENYDVEAQPPVPPPTPTPLRDDEPCNICSLENLQGNQGIWNARTFERCGHRYHSRCLMHELIQQQTCPPCLYNANLPRNHDLEAPPPRQ